MLFQEYGKLLYYILITNPTITVFDTSYSRVLNDIYQIDQYQHEYLQETNINFGPSQ